MKKVCHADFGLYFYGMERELMVFYKELYCDEVTFRHKKKIVRRLRRNAGQLGVYVIALAGGNDLFDIFHVANLKQPCFPKESLQVVGLASNYEEALKLAIKMISDFYDMYGTYQFKEELRKTEDKKWHSF